MHVHFADRLGGMVQTGRCFLRNNFSTPIMAPISSRILACCLLRSDIGMHRAF